MNLLDKAISIAIEAHEGQRNKHDGEVYVLHPQRVAVAIKQAGYSEKYQAAAWLHDVLEDTALKFSDLVELLLHFDHGTEVVTAIDALTKRVGETNVEALHRAKSNPIARCVKWYDSIGDNLRRTENIKDEATRQRLRNKYALSANILEGPGPIG